MPRVTRTERLIQYVQACKKRAAILAHQGREDYRYWEGVMVAYQDIENLLNKKSLEDEP